MKRLTTFVLLAATLVLSACSGGGSSGYDAPPPPVAAPPPPPPATQTNFTTTMRMQLDPAAMSDMAEPIEVEGVEWVFADDDGESAYAEILGAYDVTPAQSM